MREDDPYIIAELTGIHDQLERERGMTDGGGFWAPLKELCFVPEMRYRLLLAFGLGAAGQWAGGGAFTAFAPELFALVGITGNTGLFATGIYGIVKLVSSFICAFFVVDRLGRKQALFAGISLQIFCSLYLAVYLEITNNIAQSAFDSAQKHAATGAVAMIFISGLSWCVLFNSSSPFADSSIQGTRMECDSTSYQRRAVSVTTARDGHRNRCLLQVAHELRSDQGIAQYA